MRDFSESPFLVIWETSQACDLACRHCRASAQTERHPDELTTREALALLGEIRALGDPLMVFTGGDPLKRPDLFELLQASTSSGLRTTVTPSATPMLTEQAVERFQDCGVSRMAISLDGPDAATHDAFRGVAGSFDRSLLALRHAALIGLETQINTTVTRHNRHQLSEMAELVKRERARLWSVFFLVVAGRATLRRPDGGRVRGSLRVPLPDEPQCAVRHQNDGGTALPALRRPAAQEGRTGRRPHEYSD